MKIPIYVRVTKGPYKGINGQITSFGAGKFYITLDDINKSRVYLSDDFFTQRTDITQAFINVGKNNIQKFITIISGPDSGKNAEIIGYDGSLYVVLFENNRIKKLPMDSFKIRSDIRQKNLNLDESLSNSYIKNSNKISKSSNKISKSSNKSNKIVNDGFLKNNINDYSTKSDRKNEYYQYVSDFLSLFEFENITLEQKRFHASQIKNTTIYSKELKNIEIIDPKLLIIAYFFLYFNNNGINLPYSPTIQKYKTPNDNPSYILNSSVAMKFIKNYDKSLFDIYLRSVIQFTGRGIVPSSKGSFFKNLENVESIFFPIVSQFMNLFESGLPNTVDDIKKYSDELQKFIETRSFSKKENDKKLLVLAYFFILLNNNGTNIYPHYNIRDYVKPNDDPSYLLNSAIIMKFIQKDLNFDLFNSFVKNLLEYKNTQIIPFSNLEKDFRKRFEKNSKSVSIKKQIIPPQQFMKFFKKKSLDIKEDIEKEYRIYILKLRNDYSSDSIKIPKRVNKREVLKFLDSILDGTFNPNILKESIKSINSFMKRSLENKRVSNDDILNFKNRDSNKITRDYLIELYDKIKSKKNIIYNNNKYIPENKIKSDIENIVKQKISDTIIVIIKENSLLTENDIESLLNFSKNYDDLNYIKGLSSGERLFLAPILKYRSNLEKFYYDNAKVISKKEYYQEIDKYSKLKKTIEDLEKKRIEEFLLYNNGIYSDLLKKIINEYSNIISNKNIVQQKEDDILTDSGILPEILIFERKIIKILHERYNNSVRQNIKNLEFYTEEEKKNYL